MARESSSRELLAHSAVLPMAVAVMLLLIKMKIKPNKDNGGQKEKKAKTRRTPMRMLTVCACNQDRPAQVLAQCRLLVLEVQSALSMMG